jgi:hypothetical protein
MITPGKTTLSVASYEDRGSKCRKAERFVVVHRWQRDSDKSVFVDLHKYATEAEAADTVRMLT